MEFTKPEKYKVRVADKYFLNEGERFLYLKFELIEPRKIDFQAGQYVSIKINEEGERRSYSIASTPDDKHSVDVMVDMSPGGEGSQFLSGLENGDEVELLAPLGKFVVGKERAEKMLFVATGSGIVPLYTMIRDLLINKQEKKAIRLHWGLREEKDIFWLDNLERLAEEYDNFVFDLVLSQPREEWKLCSGRVQECIDRDFQGMSEWGVYICGNKQMIEEVVELVKGKGIKEDNIYYEKFY